MSHLHNGCCAHLYGSQVEEDTFNTRIVRRSLERHGAPVQIELRHSDERRLGDQVERGLGRTFFCFVSVDFSGGGISVSLVYIVLEQIWFGFVWFGGVPAHEPLKLSFFNVVC